MARNALIVVQDQNHPLARCRMPSDVEQMHWINPRRRRRSQTECAVKTRYRQNDLACVVRASGDDALACRTWSARRARSRRANTRCSTSGERCLGGGIIAQPLQFRSSRLRAAKNHL